MMRELLLREWPLYPSLIPLSSGGICEDRLLGRKDTAKQRQPRCQQPGSQSAGALRIVHISTSAWKVKIFESCPLSTTNEVSEKGLRDSSENTLLGHMKAMWSWRKDPSEAQLTKT